MKLLIEDDAGNQSVVPVNHDEITIGRKEGNKIRLTERNVSREHARLVRDNGSFYIEDVKARYGIERNGEKIEQRAPFNEGDEVRIGDYRLTLRPETSQAAQRAQQTESEAAEEVAEELRDAKGGAPAVPAPEEAQPSEPEPEPAPAGSETSSESTQIIETEPAELVVISSNFAGQRFPLDETEMVVGRGENCDIIVDHRSVSNTHAKIVRQGPNAYKIVDLNSSNGVVVDGDEYQTTHLGRGDVIELGHVKFRFVEPGENYTFSPQQAEAAAPAGGEGDNTTVILTAGALLAAVAIGVGIIWSMGLSDSDTSDESKTVVAGSGTESGVAGDETSDQAGPTAEESEGAPSNVSEAIKLAEKNIKGGNLSQAIGTLETAKGMMNPTPKQQAKIDKKMSKARMERPHHSSYEQAKDAIEDSDFETALQSLRSIPDQSVFHGLAQDEEMYDKIFDGLLKQAQGAVDSENYERATALAEKVKSQASDENRQKKAQNILDAVEKATKKVAGQKVAARTQTAGETERGGRPAEPEPETSPEPETAPADDDPEPKSGTGAAETGGGGSAGGGISTSEAKSLFQSATKKWIRGDHSGAISDCNKALSAGYKPCHRVLGMVYKKRGNKAKACRNFKKYLGTNPSDPSGIRKQMNELGCQ